MHYNRWLGLGTAISDPIKGKTKPEKWWFKLSIKRDGNYKVRDNFWITGLVSNYDNLANERIKSYVRKGRLVMVEGEIQEWQYENKKSYPVILAKLIRVEVFNAKRYKKRLLTKMLEK